MSSSNCCFLTCIQISQEASKVVWYSHLFKNFPQFVVIHTVRLRVRSGRRRGPGGASSRVGRRGTWCRRDWPGRGGARAAEKFLRADSGGGRCGVRVGEVLELSERAGDDSAGLDCVSPGGLGSAGPPRRRADVCASGARRARAPGAAGGARRRCPPGPGSVIHSDSGSGAVSA